MSRNVIYLGQKAESTTASIAGVAIAGQTIVNKTISVNSHRFDDNDLISINADLSTSIDNEELKIDRFTFISTKNAVDEKCFITDSNGQKLVDSLNVSLYFEGKLSSKSYLIDDDDKTLYDSNNLKLSFQGGYWSVSYLFDADNKQLFTSTGDALSYIEESLPTTYGTPVWYVRDGYVKGQFYLESVERISANQYTYNCISAMGILANKTHFGGIYNNATISSILYSIIGTDFRYTVDPAIANIPVSGWLPYATKRENLHQLLFACNLILIKGEDGTVIFTPCYISDPKEISGDYIYDNGSIKSVEAISSVSVSEHSYSADTSVDNVELYDTTNYVGSYSQSTVVFDEPIIVSTLTSTGTMQIISSSVNHAVVSGVGKLIGKPYTHISKTIKRLNASVTDGKEVSVDSATLVTSSNSTNVINRLYEFYTKRQIIESSWVLDDEKCGIYAKLTNIYKETASGYISKIAYSVSSIIKATAEVLAGYSATGNGSIYDHVVVLTGNGTWIVPNGSTNGIIAILIGGGDGGNAGTNGNSICAGYGGQGGNGGYVKTLTLTPQVGSTITYSCGIGGNGGTVSSPTGMNGTHTEFGSYSSSSGARYVSGYINAYNGLAYGRKGITGFDGSNERLDNEPSEAKHYGDGGNGGFGGNISDTDYYASNGTNGANGCIIIYYKEN